MKYDEKCNHKIQPQMLLVSWSVSDFISSLFYFTHPNNQSISSQFNPEHATELFAYNFQFPAFKNIYIYEKQTSAILKDF